MDHRILEEAKKLEPELIAHRRWLHSHAETGFDLENTRDYVRRALEDMGYQVKDCGKCGLVTAIGTGRKTFLLRADMDALPIREETGLECACKTGTMHACGHDLHTAMLLGAARILKNHEAELKGNVKLMFQPAEETLEGARDMMEHGVLMDVDAGMMLHAATAVPIPVGTILVSPPGVSAPSADYFTITVQGKSSHGSAPQEGIDALTAAAHILIALQEIKARELGIGDRAMLTIGTMQGGSAPNVIADSAVMKGTLRCYDEKVRDRLKQRLVEISQGIALAFRASARVTWDSGCPTLLNDETLCNQTHGWLTELLGQDMALSLQKMNPAGTPTAGGSEDFSWISHSIPTVMASIAAGDTKNGYKYPLHHPKVTFDEHTLSYGAAALAYAAMRYSEENRKP